MLEASRDGVTHWHHIRRISGHSSRFRYAFLPARFDGDSSVYFRFRLHSDAKVRRNGVVIDDVRLSCVTTENTYTYLDGTSFSAPMVSGAAALILAQHPLFTVAQLRAKLLSSVDPLPALAGRVGTGGRLDLAKAVAPRSRSAWATRCSACWSASSRWGFRSRERRHWSRQGCSPARGS